MGSRYEQSGVHYDILDAGKRLAMAAALSTSQFAEPRGGKSIDGSRGEPAFIMQLDDFKLAIVMECLGTKSSLAREYQDTCGVDRFDWVGFDGVAAIVNDLCSSGALPLAVNAYFAVGSRHWYEEPGRFASLVRGWRAACEESGAVWGGGESPMLSGIISEDEIDLAGCAIGYLPRGRSPLIGDALEVGDEIVFVASSGLHTNGSSLARAAATRVGGLEKRLSDGTTVGDALLTPSALYVRLLEKLYSEGVPISYASVITGHGLRKLMRADREFTYRVTDLLQVPVSIQFIVDTLRLPLEEAYGTLNMGIGMAFFCPSGVGQRIVSAAEAVGQVARVCGQVEDGPREVVLEPVGVRFADDSLRLR